MKINPSTRRRFIQQAATAITAFSIVPRVATQIGNQDHASAGIRQTVGWEIG